MLTFGNPAFLWGLLGLAAPVLIHLINRDLFRPLYFPSIRFILRGKMPVERKRRLRDLLLLALRLLLFAAVITALAQPAWQPRAALAGTGDEGEIMILVDASASMAGWNGWQEATNAVDEILADHRQSPVGLLISSSAPTASVTPTRDHDEIRHALSLAEPQPVAGDHREALRQALRLFSTEGGRALFIVSDLQATDWSPTALPKVPAGTEIQWRRVGQTRRDNVAILQGRTLPLPEGRRQVQAEIRNFRSEPAERTVRLRAGDETQTQALRLAPGETGSVVFILGENAAARAELSSETDEYPADDRYHLWLGPPPALRILLIAPVSEEPEKAEEVFFLTRALQTRTETQWLNFNVDAVEPSALENRLVENAHAILLLGAGPYLNSSQWSSIREYVEGGGRLLATPGKAPARQVTLLRENNLLPASFAGTVGVDRQRRPHSIDSLEPASSLARLFRDEAARALSHVAIYRYARFETSDAETIGLMRTGNGDPLLLEHTVGAGRVYASAFPFETAWTDLPVTTVFLPIIRELVAGDIPADHGVVYAETGSTPAALASRLGVPPDHSALARLDPSAPGLHMIGGTPLILNVARSESVPSTVAPVDLQAAVLPRGPAPAAATAAAGRDRSIALWPWLALAALLLFILEMPIAARLRSATRSATRPAPEPATRTEGATTA